MDDFVLWGGKAMLKAIVVAAAVFSGAAAADAAVMQATWTGTVYSGYDETDNWGTGSTDLSGQSFQMSFLYDTALGARVTVPGGYDRVTGGPAYNFAPSPILSASLSIGGVAGNLAGSYGGDILTEDGTLLRNYFTTYAIDKGYQTNGNLFESIIYGIFYDFGQNVPFSPAAVDVPFSITGLKQDCSVEFCSAFYFVEQVPFIGNYVRNTNGFLSVSSIDVRYATPAPVPLPASALLLAAAVAVAAGVRRRRKAVRA